LDLGGDYVLLAFNLSDKHRALLLSPDNRNLLSGRCGHLKLVLLDLCPINLRSNVHHFSVILSFHISHFLCLLVFQGQLLVAILFDMILESVLKFSFLFKSLCEFRVDVHIGNVAVLKVDAKLVKFYVQVPDHLYSHLALEIKYLTQPNAIDKRANSLINFCKQ
jgi:hypothetical protein